MCQNTRVLVIFLGTIAVLSACGPTDAAQSAAVSAFSSAETTTLGIELNEPMVKELVLTPDKSPWRFNSLSGKPEDDTGLAGDFAFFTSDARELKIAWQEIHGHDCRRPYAEEPRPSYTLVRLENGNIVEENKVQFYASFPVQANAHYILRVTLKNPQLCQSEKAVFAVSEKPN